MEHCGTPQYNWHRAEVGMLKSFSLASVNTSRINHNIQFSVKRRSFTAVTEYNFLHVLH